MRKVKLSKKNILIIGIVGLLLISIFFYQALFSKNIFNDLQEIKSFKNETIFLSGSYTVGENYISLDIVLDQESNTVNIIFTNHYDSDESYSMDTDYDEEEIYYDAGSPDYRSRDKEYGDYDFDNFLEIEELEYQKTINFLLILGFKYLMTENNGFEDFQATVNKNFKIRDKGNELNYELIDTIDLENLLYYKNKDFIDDIVDFNYLEETVSDYNLQDLINDHKLVELEVATKDNEFYGLYIETMDDNDDLFKLYLRAADSQE